MTYLAAIASPPGAIAKRDAPSRALWLDDVRRLVLYLGSFNAQKNLRLLLAAYTSRGAGRPARRAARGGRAPPAALVEPRFPDLPRTSGAWPDETCAGVGPVDEAEQARALSAGDPLRLPQPLRGFGLGDRKAMASGTPSSRAKLVHPRKSPETGDLGRHDPTRGEGRRDPRLLNAAGATPADSPTVALPLPASSSWR